MHAGNVVRPSELVGHEPAAPAPGSARRARRRPRAATLALAVGAAAGATVLGVGTAPHGVPSAAAAARCSTPAPKARGAGSAAATVKRIVRRAGTNTARKPRIASTTGKPPRRLVVDDVVRCRGGQAVRVGDGVQVRYSLAVWGRRGIVETTWSSGAAVPLTLRRDALIDGWVEGLPGMHVGGRRVLVVPPRKGYGAAGAGAVPKNATLVFVVDLVGLTRP